MCVCVCVPMCTRVNIHNIDLDTYTYTKRAIGQTEIRELRMNEAYERNRDWTEWQRMSKSMKERRERGREEHE